jgi:predicted ATPase
MSLTQPIICPILVGRDAQLAMIGQWIAEAREGTGRIAVNSGEAGVGKSRLVAEASPRAAEHGFAVFRGRSFEDNRGLPYAPLIDLLRGYLAPAQMRLCPRLAQQSDWRAGEASVQAYRGLGMDARGEYARAFDAFQRCRDLAGAIEHRHWLNVFPSNHCGIGRGLNGWWRMPADSFRK